MIWTVTDGQTDGRTESIMAKTALCIASYADALSKISNGHNYATRTRQPIPAKFGSVGSSGKAHRTAPFLVRSNTTWRPAAVLKNCKWPNFINSLSDSLYVLV